MSYSAKELFQDWYSEGLKRQDIPSEELTARKNAISKLLKKESHKFWISIVMEAFGKHSNDGSVLEEFIAVLKGEDDNFPLQNQNLIKVLAGCLLTQKIEDKSYTFLNDFILLAILTFSFDKNADTVILQNLVSRATNLWIETCEDQRNLNFDFAIEPIFIKPTTPSFKPTNIADPTTFGNEILPVIAALSNDDKSLIKDQSSAFEALSSIKTSLETLSEEVNVLWWILTEYSRDLKLPFKEVGFPLMITVAAKEIADSTSHLPGMGKVETLIYKTFQLSSISKIEKYKLTDIVKALGGQLEYARLLNTDFTNEVKEVCPILFAISCFAEFGEQGWEAVFSKDQDFNLAEKYDAAILSGQLYKELMLVKVLGELKNL